MKHNRRQEKAIVSRKVSFNMQITPGLREEPPRSFHPPRIIRSSPSLR